MLCRCLTFDKACLDCSLSFLWNLYSSQVHFHQVRQSCQALYLRCFPESNERAVLAVCGGADALPGEHETRLHNGIGCIALLKWFLFQVESCHYDSIGHL